MYLPGITVNTKMSLQNVTPMLYLNQIKAAMPLRGEINNLVIFIRFQGEAEFTTPLSVYKELFNSSALGVDSIFNFFRQTSYNQVNVTSSFFGTSGTGVISYEAAQSRSYYQPYNAATNPNGYTSANRGQREAELLEGAILAFKAEIDASDLNLDVDNDGVVDSITFIVSGPTSEDYWGQIIAPHSATIQNSGVYLKEKQVEGFAFLVNDMLYPGLITHEMLHEMGFEDYYKYGSNTQFPIWIWDAMGISTQASTNTSAYSKWRYGQWIDEIPTITPPQRVTLLPLTEPAGTLMNCCKIETSNPNQYLVLEYRIKTESGMDSDLPGTGLLIYRVNRERSGEGNVSGPPWELYLFRPGGSVNTEGDIMNAYLSSESGRTQAGNESFLLFFEDGEDMGIRINNVGSAGETISFDVAYAADRVADLGITKMASAASVNPGDKINYTITVTNLGPNTARGVVLQDEIASDVIDVEFSLDNGMTWRPWRNSYTIGELLCGASSTVLLRGMVIETAQGTISNTATVSATTFDPNPANNTITITTDVNPVSQSADVSVTKTASSETVTPGSVLTYTIVVRNNGPDTAMGVELEDAIPTSLTNVEYSINNGMTWLPWVTPYTIGNLLNGASRTILIRGTVNMMATGTITNTVIVSADTPDPNLMNNMATVVTTIGAVTNEADLSISKVASPAVVMPGGLLTYTIVVRNNGPDTAMGVELEDAIPTSLTNVEYSINNGMTWLPWVTPYTIGSLLSGTSRTILIRGTVNMMATGTITNTVTVDAITPDPNPANNTATVITTIGSVVGTADLSVTAVADKVVVYSGQEVTYRITVSNAGPSIAQAVILYDSICDVLECRRYSLDNGMTWQKRNDVYTIGDLTPGESRVILISGIVCTKKNCIFVNTITVRSNTPDPNLINNQAQVTVKALRGRHACGKRHCCHENNACRCSNVYECEDRDTCGCYNPRKNSNNCGC